MASGGDAGWRPLTQRAIEASGLAPGWIGLALCGGQLLLCAVWFRLTGGEGHPNRGDALLAVAIGLAPALGAYSMRGARRTLAGLASALEGPPPPAERVLGYDRGLLRSTGWSFAVGAALVLLLPPDARALGAGPLAWALWQSGAALFLGSRTLAHELHTSRALSRLAEARLEADVPGGRTLRPFSRRGAQSAFVAAPLLGSFSLLQSLASGEPVSLGLRVAVAGAVLGFAWMPVAGARRRVLALREERLRALSKALADAEQSLLADPTPAVEVSARVEALAALRGQWLAHRSPRPTAASLAGALLAAALAFYAQAVAGVVERALGVLWTALG